jgi:hypothetical protein
VVGCINLIPEREHMFDIADKVTILRWLGEGRNLGATHLIVVVNKTWDDFPVYVMPGEDSHDVAALHQGIDRQRIMEVYSLAMDWEIQLAEHRAFHWE